MATYTINLNLEKPAANEFYNIEKFNANMDKIDAVTGPGNLENWGLMKLRTHSVGGKTVNYSGLAMTGDGLTVLASTDKGLYVNGSGQLMTAAATEEEIAKGEQAYKPLVPKTFKSYKDKLDLIQTEPDNTLIGTGTIFPTKYTLDDPTETEEGIPGQICLSMGGSGDEGLYRAFICTAAYADMSTGKTVYEWVHIEPQKEYDISNRYSTKPQKIGTWIDGTPVWRQAFEHTFTELDVEDITGGGYGINYFIDDNLKDNSEAFIINEIATFRRAKTPCKIDDFIVSVAEDTIKISKDAISKDDDGNIESGIYGYIDFVTAESNIK